MTKVTISVSPELAKKFLNDEERTLGQLEQQTANQRELVAKLRLDIYGKNGSESVAHLPLAIVKDPKSKRAKRGDSDRVIASFLDSQRGLKFTHAQIVEKTGTSTSSAFRSLHRLVKDGKAKKENNFFYI